MAFCQYRECGREFTPDKEGRRFCSQACYHSSKVGSTRPGMRRRHLETCPACGKPFEVGGRVRKETTKTCSIACANRIRYRSSSKANTLTDRQAGYVAGFLDGEGSIMVLPKRDTCIVKISVTSSSRQVLEWLAEITGVGAVSQHRKETEKHAATWFWQVYSEAAESILLQVQSDLVIKEEQGRLALEVQRRLRDPTQKADRTWQQAAIEQMRALNRRGPK